MTLKVVLFEFLVLYQCLLYQEVCNISLETLLKTLFLHKLQKVNECSSLNMLLICVSYHLQSLKDILYHVVNRMLIWPLSLYELSL